MRISYYFCLLFQFSSFMFFNFFFSFLISFSFLFLLFLPFFILFSFSFWFNSSIELFDSGFTISGMSWKDFKKKNSEKNVMERKLCWKKICVTGGGEEERERERKRSNQQQLWSAFQDTVLHNSLHPPQFPLTSSPPTLWERSSRFLFLFLSSQKKREEQGGKKKEL